MDGLYIGIGAFCLVLVLFTVFAVDIWQCCLGRQRWWRK